MFLSAPQPPPPTDRHYCAPTPPSRGLPKSHGGHTYLRKEGLTQRGQLGGQHLGDLCGVQRRALTEVVAGDKEIKSPGVVERPSDAAHPRRVGTHCVDRHRELPGGRI